MKNHITKYMRKVGDSVEPSYADLFDRIEALESKNARLRRKLNLFSVEALTQYRVALERCVEATEAYRDAICAPEVFFALGGKPTEALIKAGALHKSAIALATPLIEKGRK